MIKDFNELLAKRYDTDKPEEKKEKPVLEVSGEYIQKPLDGIDDSYIKPKANNVVTQDNALVSATYQLSLNAKRVLLLAISQVDSTRPDIYKDDYRVRIKAKDFHEYYGGHINSAYKEYKKGIDDLKKAEVIELDNDSRDKGFNWITRWDVYKQLGYADITLNRSLMPYLTNLSSAFTSYKLINVGGLRSVYSIRLYELLMKHERRNSKYGFYKVDLIDLRFIFNLPDNKYTRYSHFKSAIISRAVNEINEKTNIRVFTEEVKSGRTVMELIFHFGKNTKRLPIEDENYKG